MDSGLYPSRLLSDKVLRIIAFVTLGPVLSSSGTLVTQVGVCIVPNWIDGGKRSAPMSCGTKQGLTLETRNAVRK